MRLRKKLCPDTGALLRLKVQTYKPTQKFTQKAIDDLGSEGLLTLDEDEGTITVHADEPRELVYKIVKRPGYYCCFDEKKLAGEKLARRYVTQNFPDQESPDPNNPAGYRQDNFYLCELVDGGKE
ncbi:hypothetical protein SAMN05216302_106412 [Nitrosomonas aestuarii]|uniref:Uncharacterized protein n=1 Tax=Nitrosomonas aestuarii TaxID=52441 RepID=A0A1I4GW93_9PROT|nr:hypothetical protein [Nitrosomonas aestuarii]SFL34298.1 hypothetical protein SAMN05216302_106412 [Nitrosomonas aestuarii]